MPSIRLFLDFSGFERTCRRPSKVERCLSKTHATKRSMHSSHNCVCIAFVFLRLAREDPKQQSKHTHITK